MACSILAPKLTWDPKLCQICWWNINNNNSFHYRWSQRKNNISKFFKKSPKPYFRPIQIGAKNEFSRKKNALSIYKYSNYLPLCQKSEKTNEPFLRKLLERHTKTQFISLISLWFIEKTCNLIGQENFGPYLRNQNFSKYEMCSSIKELQ